jgi:phage terminase small subunit
LIQRRKVNEVRLTEKQKRFADYYIESGNGAESAIRAGYSEKTAKEIASENLTKPNIKKYIDEQLSIKDSERIASQDEVLSYLTLIMRGEETEQVLIGVGKGAQSITDMEVSAKDRIKAAELLGKRYGLWVDKQDIDVKGAVTFVDDLGEEDEA